MAHDTVNTTPMKASQAGSSSKKDFLAHGEIQHVDITKNPGIVPLVDAMKHMAFTARDLNRAAEIYDRMLADTDSPDI